MTAPRPHLWHELAFKSQDLVPVAGLDEAGRGAWAGPVVAGAVILPIERDDLIEVLDGVRDSKKCTALQRERLFDIVVREADAARVGLASSDEIDLQGIVGATKLAMTRALSELDPRPAALIIDHVRLNNVNLHQRNIVRGEDQSLSVASASILAKVARDRMMVELDAEFPQYGFARNKGYGTAEHQAALAEHGPCPLHRRTFEPIRARLFPDGMAES